MAWCREKRWWTTQYQWSKVIFSDESQICIGQDKHVYVWWKRGEGWRPDLVKGRTDCNFSVMVWGCICYNGVGTLTKVEGNINANKYISILEDNIWPVIVRHFPGNDYLFQDDNAPVHRARSTKEYLARTHLKNMSWPAQSSDLNVIENIWLYIKRKLQVRIHKINSNSDLFRKSFRIWQIIPLTYIRNLYRYFVYFLFDV